MKNPTSDVSQLPSSRKRQEGYKTTPRPSPPEVELFFFSLVRKWGSPEGWQAWWEMAAAIENRDHFVIPGGYCGMIRRLYLVERLAASTASCGEGADETTLRRLSRQLKQQWWQAEDVKLWPWLGELVEKAGATGQEPGFQMVSSQASLSSAGMWTSGARLPTWDPLPKPGCASGFCSPFVSHSLSWENVTLSCLSVIRSGT